MGIPFVYTPDVYCEMVAKCVLRNGGVSEHYTAIVSRVRRLCLNGRP